MKLIFVYNADSGFANALFDVGHKALDPDTYQCNLCSLTHGIIGEHKEWQKFREKSTAEIKFLHRDEFEREYEQEFDYPVILKQEDCLSVMISQTELNSISTLDSLIQKVSNLLAENTTVQSKQKKI